MKGSQGHLKPLEGMKSSQGHFLQLGTSSWTLRHQIWATRCGSPDLDIARYGSPDMGYQIWVTRYGPPGVEHQIWITALGSPDMDDQVYGSPDVVTRLTQPHPLNLAHSNSLKPA